MSARSWLNSDSRTRGFYSKRGSSERELKRGGMKKEFELDFSFLCDPVNRCFCFELSWKKTCLIRILKKNCNFLTKYFYFVSSGSPWINNCWSGLVDDYERPTLLVSLIDKMEYVYSFLVLYLRDTRIAGNNENKYIYMYIRRTVLKQNIVWIFPRGNILL